MVDRQSSSPQTHEESALFLETFRRCLSELGYKPGERVSRGDYAIAVFRSSREFTCRSTNAGRPDGARPGGAREQSAREDGQA